MDWLGDYTSLSDGFRREMAFTLGYARDRMLHAFEQLSLEQAWWRPHESMNAAGNLMLHVCGNLRQWIVVGVGAAGACGAPESDDRDRPGEFAERGPIPSDELSGKLRTTVDQAIAVIESVSDDELLRPRFVQIGQVTGMGAIVHSVAHLEGHAQEMIYLARLQLGEGYRFKDAY